MGLQQNLVECDEIGLFAERPQTAIGAVDHVIDKSAGSNTANARRQRIANRELSNVKGRVPFSYPSGIPVSRDLMCNVAWPAGNIINGAFV
jgi:hypothetical protein